jgi:hypothetical protein
MGMDETNTHYIFRTRWLKYQQKARFPQLLLQQLWHILISMQPVLAICGFANVVDHTSIINNESFQSIADFGVAIGR